MHSLFMLLLVVNLSYLIWGVAFSEKSTIPNVAPQPQAEQTLMLLSEQLKNSANEIGEKASLTKTKEGNNNIAKLNIKEDKNMSPSIGPANTCYSLGPILDEKDSKKLEQKLEQNGFKTKQKAITDKEPKSYWVYFPAEKTLDDARAVVSQLQVAKVKDYQIIRKGTFTNAISLGLYNGYSRAKIRVRDLQKLGFNPKIQTRYREVTRHWLDFQETDTNRLKTSIWDKIQKDNPLQKLARPCVDPVLNPAHKKTSASLKKS